ncbi:hypothetical protein [Streptomyces sp. NPDC056160]|uniref:hypothetical protein n=1 Tax=Streptomyces sp. NPDC056160 TaxID=3345731 RepID=UPI0035D68E9A
MSARNRRLPRHRAWPLTRTDVAECLGPHLHHLRELRFLTGDDSPRSPRMRPLRSANSAACGRD